MVRSIRFAPLPDTTRLDNTDLLDLESVLSSSKSVTTPRASIDSDSSPPSPSKPSTTSKKSGPNASPTSPSVSSLGGSLSRVLSLGSGKSKAAKQRRSSDASDPPSGLIATLPTGQSSRKMLNGRIYGGRRHTTSSSSSNPFATAQGKVDPEFVEWGYGGMGSVRHGAGVGGQVWDKLLTDESTYTTRGHVGGSRAARRPENTTPRSDSDDGSGMSWVRRRREQREREQMEKAAKEREESQNQTNPPSGNHLTRAVNIPMRHDPRRQSRDSALTASTTTEYDGSPPSLDSDSDTTSSSETLDEGDDDDIDDVSLRKTAVCAGVEKVSHLKNR